MSSTNAIDADYFLYKGCLISKRIINKSHDECESDDSSIKRKLIINKCLVIHLFFNTIRFMICLLIPDNHIGLIYLNDITQHFGGQRKRLLIPFLFSSIFVSLVSF